MIKIFTQEEDRALFSLYNQGHNDYQVAQILHVGRNRLRVWRNEHDIPSKSNKKGLSSELCHSIISDRASGESFSFIAKKYGATRTSITRLLKINDFPYTIFKRISPKNISDYVLSQEQRDILTGDMFGDGHICRSSRISCYYKCSHSIDQEEFVLLKALRLKPLSNRIYYGKSTDGP